MFARQQLSLFLMTTLVTSIVVNSQDKSIGELLNIPLDQCIDRLTGLYASSVEACNLDSNSESKSSLGTTQANSQIESIDKEFLLLSSEMKKCVIDKLIEEVNFEHFVDDCTQDEGFQSIILHPVRFTSCFLQQVHNFCETSSDRSKSRQSPSKQ